MPIEKLENLSSDTKNLLKEVMKKKQKKERYEGLRNLHLVLSLLLSLSFFILLNFFEITNILDPFSTLASIISSPFYLSLIVLIAITVLYHNFYQKKLKKAKDKLNAVRSEAIDHLNDTKNMNLQDNASTIKKMMKDEYDINLYVKNK